MTRLLAALLCLSACTGADDPTDRTDPEDGTTTDPPSETGSTASPTGDTATVGLVDLTKERCLDDDGCDLDALLDLGQQVCAFAVGEAGGDASAARGYWSEGGGFTRSTDSAISWACVSDDLDEEDCATLCPATGFENGGLVPYSGCVCTATAPPVGKAADAVRAPACDGASADADISIGRQQLGTKDLFYTSVQVVCRNDSSPISKENCITTRARANLHFETSLTEASLTAVGCYLTGTPGAP